MFLLSLLLSVAVQVHHRQVPVILDRDVAIASVEVPEDEAPEWSIKACGLPSKALRNAFVREGQLFVNIDGSRIKDLSKPFRICMKAKGMEVREMKPVEERGFSAISY